MTIARLLPLHVHGALEATLAVIIMATAFVLAFSPAALIASISLGALMLAVALATHADEHGGMAISTHAAFDVIFALALGSAAIASAVIGEVAAALLLGSSAVALTLLTTLTRYSPRAA
jgi:hypothetical protein